MFQNTHFISMENILSIFVILNEMQIFKKKRKNIKSLYPRLSIRQKSVWGVRALMEYFFFFTEEEKRGKVIILWGWWKKNKVAVTLHSKD